MLLRYVVSALLFVGGVAAQTYEVCIRIKATPAKLVCQDVPNAALTAANQFVAVEGTTINGVFTPTYKSASDLLFKHLYGLYLALVPQFPSGALQTAINNQVTATAAVETQKAAATPKPPQADNPQ